MEEREEVLNLIDAVKSGKKFKRRDGHETLDSHIPGYQTFYHLSAEDILSDEWITVETPILITSSQFDEALLKVSPINHPEHSVHPEVFKIFIKKLKEELGFQ